MRMRYSALALLLVLVNQAFLSMGLANPETRITSPTSKISEAVFQLSEQAKKDDLVGCKNHFLVVKKTSKLTPIEPTLGKEMRPDLVEPR